MEIITIVSGSFKAAFTDAKKWKIHRAVLDPMTKLLHAG
jgi:hypothetical protein